MADDGAPLDRADCVISQIVCLMSQGSLITKAFASSNDMSSWADTNYGQSYKKISRTSSRILDA